MDGSRFDLWTRRRFARVTGGTVAVLLGVVALQETEAKKRRKKRRTKPPQQRCQTTREACSTSGDSQCCNGLVCDDNGCVGDPVCLQTAGGPCRDTCDCRLGLECSERAGDTCQQCVLLQNPCQSHDECCLLSAACGSTMVGPGVCCQQPGAACAFDSDCCLSTGKCGLNGCGGAAPVCCKGVGLSCEGNCDCCDPLRCVNATCQ